MNQQTLPKPGDRWASAYAEARVVQFDAAAGVVSATLTLHGHVSPPSIPEAFDLTGERALPLPSVQEIPLADFLSEFTIVLNLPRGTDRR